MLRFLLLAALALLGSSPALAQNTTALVVGTCGTVSIPFKAGNAGPLTVDTTGKLCSSASGGGGTPGGSNGQIQFNNAGAFGGGAGTAWDDTNRTLTLTGATVTTSKPLLDMAQTWNAGGVAFSALKLNVTDTASASGSLLLDLRVGASSKFSVTKAGAVTSPSSILGSSIIANTGGSLLSKSGAFAGVQLYASADGSAVLQNYAGTAFSVLALNTDSGISRLAAASLAIGNGTAGDVTGTLSLARGDFYNLRTDASNYERMAGKWSANEWYFGTENAGTGVARALHVRSAAADGFYFGSGGGDQWKIASGHMLAITDNTYDIGASGANRARNAYLAGKIVTGSTTLHETSVALTNGAAAATGTLTNAPVAGNPTKWIPINDNGTTRYVPAW